MTIKDNKEFIIILVGFVLTITIYGSLIGLPLMLIGAYLLNKKAKNPLQSEVNKINKEIQEKEKILQEYNEQIGVNKTLMEKRQEIGNINQRLATLEQEKTDEINKKLQNTKQQLHTIEKELQTKQTELTIIETKYSEIKDIKDKNNTIQQLDQEIRNKKQELGMLDDAINMQEYGLYEPQYKFTKSEQYKDKLKEIRNEQKQMVKDKQAAVCDTEWTVEGDKRKGQAMTNQNIRQAIYTFNVECQQIISKTRPSNVHTQKEKIRKVYDRINKMNERNVVRLTPQYLQLKYDELELAIEYEMKKQVEKELLREAREREKEEKAIKRELERKERQIQKQKIKLEKKLAEAQRKAEQEAKTEAEKQELREQIKALQQQIAKQDEDQKDIENKRLRTGAGFVYIISNIGSFGEGVYKIGVTRRDDPEVRVNELSNASVPFKYDVNAFIFSEQAFDLETELHKKFDKQRLNKVNTRKEFFKLTSNDIENIVKKHKDSTYSFTLEAEAFEYYKSLQVEKQQQKIGTVE
ncbi:MAG: hypothetical protein BZ138_05940 [Methanosphaera sp. rholeuAM270]|nr:MAG: hypothetical protein BZ138_05940 [Methanosphaera sp. rholeuAM270]